MKNTIKRSFILLLTLPLCGCFPTGQRNIGTAPKRVEGFNTDNIIIYETDIKTASVYDAKLRNPAHDELPDFFKEMGIKEQQKMSYSNNPAEDISIYDLNNSAHVSLGLHGISYSIYDEKFSFQYFADLSHSNGTPDMTRDLFKKTELSSFSSADAKNVFEDTLSKLGIDNYTMCDHIAFDYETYNRLNTTGKTGEPLPEITEDEEAYCVYANLTVDDIPLVKQSVQTDYNLSYKTQLSAIIDKKGMIRQMECGYKFDELKETKNGNICSYDDALNALKLYYSKIKIKQPIKVRSCQLEYMMTYNMNSSTLDECVLTPVWAFHCQYDEDTIPESGHVFTFIKAVNALEKDVVL